MELFSELNLKQKTLRAIDNIHFTKMTNTQSLVLPVALSNKNVICKGKTGSGKTHSFIIPIAEKINESDHSLQALILTPTRELAIQTYQRLKEFFEEYDIKIAILTGGMDTLREKNRIVTTPQILVGTPEKLVEIAIESGLVNLSTVKCFVIDEADMTLEMGFLNEVDKLAYLCRHAQMMLFSATIPVGLKQFAKKYFKEMNIVEDNKTNHNSQIEHILYPTRERDKYQLLLYVINNINPYLCLIFANTNEEVNKVYKFLVNNGVECGIIHGDLQARERKSNIKRAIDGKYRFIVCSDIASRGIDIEGVSHVISLGFPKTDLSFYTHRVGRAGRVDMNGTAITFYEKADYDTIPLLEKQGINFVVKEIKNGEWRELKEFDARSKRKQTSVNPELQARINKAVRMSKTKKVKPNYKKKVKMEVDKAKRRYKREVIQKDIKNQIKERAIKRTKGEE